MNGTQSDTRVGDLANGGYAVGLGGVQVIGCILPGTGRRAVEVYGFVDAGRRLC